MSVPLQNGGKIDCYRAGNGASIHAFKRGDTWCDCGRSERPLTKEEVKELVWWRRLLYYAAK